MALKRKDSVPDAVRTPGKDDAAEKIAELNEELDVTELSKSDLAERIGWSRSHTQTVLKEYFESGDDSDAEPVGIEVEIRIPNDVDKEDYLRGWIDGYARRRDE